MATESVSKRHGPLIERAGWAVFWNAAFFPLKALIGFASSIVIVRLLHIVGYSFYNVAIALLTTLGLFADLGIERTLPRFYPEVEMRLGRRGVVNLLFWVSIIKAGVLVVLVDMPDEPHPDPTQVKRPSMRSLRQRLVSYARLNYLINWSVYFYDLPFVVLALGLLVNDQKKAAAVAIISLAFNFTKQFLRSL